MAEQISLSITATKNWRLDGLTKRIVVEGVQLQCLQMDGLLSHQLLARIRLPHVCFRNFLFIQGEGKGLIAADDTIVFNF